MDDIFFYLIVLGNGHYLHEMRISVFAVQGMEEFVAPAIPPHPPTPKEKLHDLSLRPCKKIAYPLSSPIVLPYDSI